jgi:branched-subunit amino acid aminotransferase/4-amino-4-deoxychorismate lyase
VLLELGEKTGLSIEEAPLETEELFAADEVFIASTTREVQPVSEIEDRTITEVNGPFTQLLAETFSQYVAESLRKAGSDLAGR